MGTKFASAMMLGLESRETSLIHEGALSVPRGKGEVNWGFLFVARLRRGGHLNPTGGGLSLAAGGSADLPCLNRPVHRLARKIKWLAELFLVTTVL